MKRYLIFFAMLLGTASLTAQSPTVSSLVATGTGVKWYDAPTGGNLLPSNTALVNGQHYYASQTINGCESTIRLDVVANVIIVAAPTAGTHIPSQTQIVWNWNTVSGATGYKWNISNTYSSAADLGNVLTRAETPLTCNTAYTRYVWAYNGSGCVSGETTLTQATSSCVTGLWTFTNAGTNGRTGPTQTQVNNAYSGTSLQGSVTINTQGVQEWSVPESGVYTIRAKGAQGARSGGLGAEISGTFNLTQGEILKIAVGQSGVDGSADFYTGGGGGGGSYVIIAPYNNNSSILVIAGGGGGFTNYGLTTEMNAFSTSSGGSTYLSGGGSSGNGGNSGLSNGAAAGGGGFLSNGTNGAEGDVLPVGGASFINGSIGGTEGHTNGFNGGDGGFGGGGGGWDNSYNRSGGGGGYSGGQGGSWNSQQSGGGGGSFNSGTNQSNTSGSNIGNGQVIITR